MKISWMNIVGALLAILFGYMYVTWNASGAMLAVFAIFPFLAGLTCAFFGSRQRFVDGFHGFLLKFALALFAAVGGILTAIQAPVDENTVSGKILAVAIILGFAGGIILFFFGVVVWILNELRGGKD